MTLTFINIPPADLAAFIEGVTATLDQLNLHYDYDSTSPPDADGESTYTVVGVTECPT